MGMALGGIVLVGKDSPAVIVADQGNAAALAGCTPVETVMPGTMAVGLVPGQYAKAPAYQIHHSMRPATAAKTNSSST